MFQQFFAGRTIVILSVVAGCTPRNVINFSMQMERFRGVFGRWDDRGSTTSRSETIDADGNRTITCTTSTSNAKVIRIEDTSNLKEFRCAHCKEVSFDEF